MGQRGGLLEEFLAEAVPEHDFARLTAAELTEFLRDQIAPHKIPVFWTFADGLPMTHTGKTQKYVLRQQAADGTLTFDQVRPPLG